MYKIKPYYNNVLSNNVFDLFDDFFKDTRVRERNFKIDVRDLKDKYIVEAELPGLSKEDVNIKYENDYLTVSVHKEEVKEENTDYVHKEITSFSSERRLYLPDVDPTKLGAKLDNGILVITLNKSEHAANSYLIDIE